MKLQCNACEAAEARVLCCADEAVLCCACDERVHAANKLARKHQRVPLTGSSSSVPKCDICKENSGYFFCLEDRALLCRKCDTAIHSTNSHVSAHQRFLLTGVKIGSEPPEHVSAIKEQSNPVIGIVESSSKQVCRSPPMAYSGETHQAVSSATDRNMELPAKEASFTGGDISGCSNDWPLDDFFDFSHFNQNYSFIEHGSSKTDGGNPESFEGSPACSSADEDSKNELFRQVPETSCAVPEIPSPPTASGLNWPNNSHRQFVEDSLFVPDVCYDFQDLQQCLRSSPVPKRRMLH